jgi:hypothetical protein
MSLVLNEPPKARRGEAPIGLSYFIMLRPVILLTTNPHIHNVTMVADGRLPVTVIANLRHGGHSYHK